MCTVHIQFCALILWYIAFCDCFGKPRFKMPYFIGWSGTYNNEAPWTQWQSCDNVTIDKAMLDLVPCWKMWCFGYCDTSYHLTATNQWIQWVHQSSEYSEFTIAVNPVNSLEQWIQWTQEHYKTTLHYRKLLICIFCLESDTGTAIEFIGYTEIV